MEGWEQMDGVNKEKEKKAENFQEMKDKQREKKRGEDKEETKRT